MAMPRADQLFIVEFDLADLSSHFFNQVLGFKVAAQKIGLVPHVLLPKAVNPSLLGVLGGAAVIDFPHAFEAVSEAVPDGFADADLRLRSLWDEIEVRGVSSHDMVMITSGRPLVIYSLGVWLGRLAADRRPTVFVRFFDHGYINLSTMKVSARSWVYRFAARDLALRPGQERVFLTLNNAELASTLGRICYRRVFEMPVPKYYGDLSVASLSGEVRRTIYVHLNARAVSFMPHVSKFVRDMLDAHPDINFLVKCCLNAMAPGDDIALPVDLLKRGVELIAAEQSHDDHLATIARSDILLLPYEASEYRVLASGIFAEGAALGKVMVYPNGTWMADQIADGYAAGTGFNLPTTAEILAALSRTLEDFSDLQISAQQKSASFRQYHSCDHNLRLMRGLAGSPPDMRLTYRVGSTIDFADNSLSRVYLGSGWSSTEAAGVWSDGVAASLSLRWEQKPSAELVINLHLTPFVVDEREQQVEVLINGGAVEEWHFRRVDAHPVRRSFRVPTDFIVHDELTVCLRFPNAISPLQVGMSLDARMLGVMLHAVQVVEEFRPAVPATEAGLDAESDEVEAPLPAASRAR